MIQPLAHIPLFLSKSVNEDGREEYRMRGRMSTTSRDDDGQYLNPSGFDMTDFMGPEGYINWHHQQNKNPLALIGKPTSYELVEDKNEMWIDFRLFENNPMAQQVWKLQEVLEEQGLQLGLSLEGEATKIKDPKTGELISADEAKRRGVPFTFVEEARISGCAVTPSAKNKDSVVSLLKGSTEDFDLIKGDVIREGSGSEVGGERHPLALESLEDELKSLEYDSETGAFKTDRREIPKKYHTKGSAREYLKKCYSSGETTTTLTKSQVFAVLGKILPLNSNSFEEIFNFTLNLEKGNNTIMEKNTVSPENLTKALEELEILSKGVEEFPAEVEAKKEAKEDGGVEKRLDLLEKGVNTLIDVTKQLLKANPSPEEEEEEEEEGEGEGKAEDPKKEEAPTEELEKGKSGGIAELIKGMLTEQKSEIDNLMTQTNELIKGQNTTIAELQQKVEDIASQSAGRKAVTTRSYLQKGNHETDSDLNFLSASQDKRQILDILTPKAVGETGIIDENLSKAIMQFEQGDIVTNVLQNSLKKEGFTMVQ